MTKLFRINSLFCAAFLLIGTSTHAIADNNQQSMDLPPVTQSNQAELPEETTHPIIRLTPDKSELIRLDAPATSIIVGNPAHVNVIADSSKTLVIVPRLPGATHFTVLGKSGQVIMQRHIIVASPKQDYLRVKRTCSEDSDTCKNTSVFYCPDMCHEIHVEGQTKEATASTDDTSSGGNNSRNASPAGDTASNDIPDQ